MNEISEQKVKELVDMNRKLYVKYIVGKNTVILDFYNIYCSYTKFNQYKIFTLESFEKCLHNICKFFKRVNLYVISKDIFEVPKEVIIAMTKKYGHLNYIIVDDNHIIKSQNRERDDFMCLLLNKDNPDSYIISNDRYSNIRSIIAFIKPFKITHFYKGEVTETSFQEKDLEILKKEMLHFKPLKKCFKYI